MAIQPGNKADCRTSSRGPPGRASALRGVAGSPGGFEIGITLSNEALQLTLDEAIALARGSDPSPTWSQRVKLLGSSGLKTYIAALGGALLAKATDPRVDSLTQDQKAGSHGYSLRMVTEFLAARNNGRYHLGAQGKNPMNNRPFLNGPGRIDDFQKVSKASFPVYLQFLDYLRDLNKLTKAEATEALAAYLRVRMAVAEADRAARREELSLRTTLAPDEFLGICERYVRDRTEGGKKGQALIAAIFDCLFAEVTLQPINNPKPGDVRILRGGEIALPIEVKQVATQEETAFDLAEEASRMGAGSALLVVLADDHVPLDRERVRRGALADFGVALEICESVRETVGMASVFSGGRAGDIFSGLPSTYATRMREHEVSQAAQDDWRERLAAREATKSAS